MCPEVGSDRTKGAKGEPAPVLPRLGRIGLEALPLAERATVRQCQFEIYREDQRKVTSTKICGGMWRWRLCSSSGAVLAQSQGYLTDAACLEAVAALRNFAASARIIQQG